MLIYMYVYIWKKPKHNSLRNKCLVFNIYFDLCVFLASFSLCNM